MEENYSLASYPLRHRCLTPLLQLIALQIGQSLRNPSKIKNKQGSKKRAEIEISRYRSKPALTYSLRAFLTQQKHNKTTFTMWKHHYEQPQPTAFSDPTQKLFFPASQPDSCGLLEVTTTALLSNQVPFSCSSRTSSRS